MPLTGSSFGYSSEFYLADLSIRNGYIFLLQHIDNTTSAVHSFVYKGNTVQELHSFTVDYEGLAITAVLNSNGKYSVIVVSDVNMYEYDYDPMTGENGLMHKYE